MCYAISIGRLMWRWMRGSPGSRKYSRWEKPRGWLAVKFGIMGRSAQPELRIQMDQQQLCAPFYRG